MTTTLASLRAEVRELIGYGVYDRCFESEWADDAITFACDQVCATLGLTRTETDVVVINRTVVQPEDEQAPQHSHTEPDP